MEGASIRSDRHIPAIAVSRGIGIGRLVFLPSGTDAVHKLKIPKSTVRAELGRLESAVELVRQELAAPKTKAAEDLLQVQLLILEHSPLLAEIRGMISDELANAEWAVKSIADHHRERQFSVPSPEFREKGLEVEDVAKRIIRCLRGGGEETLNVFDSVVVARELRPSAMIELGHLKPAAIVTEHAGWTSHASILAREYKLPMVSGVNAGATQLSEGTLVIVDAVNGELVVEPSLSTIERYRGMSFERDMRTVDRRVVDGSVLTRDNVEVFLHANVDNPDAYREAKRAGAVGIGLFRSESLLSDGGTLPTAEIQENEYRRILDAADGDSVSVRTFDIGIEFFRPDRNDRNPSLGLRAVRLGLARPDDLRDQLRALLMAAVGADLRIIIPMVSGIDELRAVKEMIDGETAAIVEAGREAGEPKIGVMIEVPSAVLTAHEIAEEVDFLCLGTNDLVQYLLAVDRDNDAIAGFYKTLHPAVLRAIQNVISAGIETNTPVVVCGEMAGSPFYVPVLLGLGATELSMNVNAIRPVRHLVEQITVEECARLVNDALRCKTASEVETLFGDHYGAYWEELFPPGLLNTHHL